MDSATKGTLIQTTMAAATAKKDVGLASQLWPEASTPRWVRAQLSRPRRQSTIQIQTVIVATTGMAQASSSATWRMARVTVPTPRMSSARRPPMSTVVKAQKRQKPMERRTTTQTSPSVTMRR